jgi:hypothetical protein
MLKHAGHWRSFFNSLKMNTAIMKAEPLFKRILGGCTSVVEGLGSLRNKLSDSHGKGKTGYKPLPRHAELAVNLSGAMATFLVATWRDNFTDHS